MQTMLPLFTSGATDLMALSALMSGMAFLIVILATSVYVISVGAAGISFSVYTVLSAISFIISKLWIVSTLRMVALYSCVGGGAASAIAAVEMLGNKGERATDLALTLIGAMVGAVSLSGSVIAWTKLNGISKRNLKSWDRQAFSLVVVVTALAVIGCIGLTAQSGADRLIAVPGLIYWLSGCGLLLGALITLPIDREQMPTVIYFYNAFTGLAIGLEGLALWNPTLIIAGTLVCAARMLLTLTMVRLSVIEA